jgi:tetratricopeptide (TPR) repeat protein
VNLPALLALALSLVLATHACAADPPAKAPTPEQIAEWVRNLGSADFPVRQRASRSLWEAGRTAEPELRKAVNDPDAEVVRRAREILDRFDWGILPDTPHSVSTLIEKYRANPNTIGEVIPGLFGQGVPGFTALMRMSAMEKEPALRQSLHDQLGNEMPRFAAGLLLDGKHAKLEELLEGGLTGSDSLPYASYAVYHLQRGNLDAKIKEWEKLAAAGATPRTNQVLAHLYRAKGDLTAARRFAEAAKANDLLETILIEQEDWKALVKLLDKPLPPGQVLPAAPDYWIVCLRLAGDKDRAEGELRKLTRNDPVGHGGVPSYLLAGRPDAAATILRQRGDLVHGFELLNYQHHFREAFTSLERLRPPPGQGLDFNSEALIMKQYARLGDRKKALESSNRIVAEFNRGGNFNGYQILIQPEYQCGLRNEAFEHAAVMIEKTNTDQDNPPTNVLPFIFPNCTNSANAWWTFMRKQYPKETIAERLKRMRDLLEPKKALTEPPALLKAMEAEYAKKTPESANWLPALTETARLLGLEAQERRYLEQQAETKTADILYRLGDLHAEHKRWKEAAEIYRQLWEQEKRDPLALALYGWALTQSGQEKEGQRLSEIATLIPLGSQEARSALAEGLMDHGRLDASLREWSLVNLFASPSPRATMAARYCAEKAAAEKDAARSAMFRQKQLLGEARDGLQLEIEKPFALGLSVREKKARALVAAGRVEEARKEAQAILELSPGRVELAIELVPELTKRGQKKEADELFNRILAVHEGLCKQYPDSAWAHNNVAWLCARCRRNLDTGLEHARKAVTLEPESAGPLDTLAEVHFQRGEKDKALEASRKSTRLSPTFPYFRQQCERIQAGNPETEIPPEPLRY